MSTIICDLDGTLFNIDHRLHFIEGEQKDWDGFFAAVEGDTPYYWCWQLLIAMRAQGHKVMFVTGRSESTRHETWKQLDRLKLGDCIMHMRPIGDHRPDHELKKLKFEQSIRHKKDVLFVLEDRARVVQMWREQTPKMIVLQCAAGEF